MNTDENDRRRYCLIRDDLRGNRAPSSPQESGPGIRRNVRLINATVNRDWK